MRHKYCPECGTKLIMKMAGDDGETPYCEPCGKYWFDSFASCVIILVANEQDEIALLSQSYLSDEYMTFVAGFIKPGESAEETARREVKEELGLDLERLEYEGTHWFASAEQLMHAYVGFAKKKDFKLSQEVDRAIWVHEDEATALMFPDRDGNTQHILFRKYKELKGEDR